MKMKNLTPMTILTFASFCIVAAAIGCTGVTPARPGTENELIGGGHIRMPNLIDRDPDYKPTVVGVVTSKHEVPQTEGYRPALGYFSQTSECDELMHVLMGECFFKEFEDSYYHKGAGTLFKDGKPGSSSKYVENLMGNMGPEIQLYNEPKAKAEDESSKGEEK